MTQTHQDNPLWTPSESVIRNANIIHYMDWLVANRDQRFNAFDKLWRWSVDNLADFWGSIWDYFGVISSQPASTVLASKAMPGAQWFVGAQLNIAENFFARANENQPALIFKAEDQLIRS